MRDPAIKLFGKEIPVPKNGRNLGLSGEGSAGDCRDEYGISDDDRGTETAACLEDGKVKRTGEGEEETENYNKDQQAEKSPVSKFEKNPKSPVTGDLPNLAEHLESRVNPATPTGEEDPPLAGPDEKSVDDPNDMSNPEQKPLKKPDKILPCPRCSSTDTKFCYYNNYNINQPRYFCRSCQRYWTAGGTMRNVPVGAGRRKSKNPASHCRHITITEALDAARIDPFKPTKGMVLSFSPDLSLCKSMSPMQNLAQKKSPMNGVRNVFNRVYPTRDDLSSGSSITTSNSVDVMRNRVHEQGFHVQVPCRPGIPYPYHWNSAIPMPAFCPPGYPIPVFPAPCWDSGIPGAWNVPLFCPTSPSTSLGKHSRDGELIKPSNPIQTEDTQSEIPVLVPKTLRIDDPDEAARSSIWDTLGIKNNSTTRKGLFEAFRAKDQDKNDMSKASSLALRANPAALSRSLNFQEGF